MINITLVSEPSEKPLIAVNALIGQLSQTAKPITMTEFSQIISSTSTFLYLAEEEGRYWGMLSLVIFRIPTGLRAWVEDVVVDKDARGKGIGKALSEYALMEANRMGVLSVDLTSRPSRVAANQLYQKVGFQLRQTNVYRFQHKQ